MLDFSRLHTQLSDFSAYRVQEESRQHERLKRALAALAACSGEWPLLQERVEAARPKWLVARPQEAPARCHTCSPRPTPVTVVATDGSQIYPDRSIEPTCYLLNISRIAFHYGTTERPLMDAVPYLRYRQRDLEEVFDEQLPNITAEVVSALRDELELTELYRTATASIVPGRPIVAMADGTLIRWMLRSMRNHHVEDRMIARYVEVLGHFRETEIPVCSYISSPGNTEVVNLLRVQLGECDEPAPDASISGLIDRQLFESVLQAGQRSVVFESGSHIQKEYGPENRICYFYVRVRSRKGSEIGRVELPRWVADEPALVDLIHAVVLDQAEKGDGYPVILSEAHERAVVRMQDKEVFYHVLERQMQHAGIVRLTGSRKQLAKRVPRV